VLLSVGGLVHADRAAGKGKGMTAWKTSSVFFSGKDVLHWIATQRTAILYVLYFNY
jgi:hypothetical protein